MDFVCYRLMLVCKFETFILYFNFENIYKSTLSHDLKKNICAQFVQIVPENTKFKTHCRKARNYK